MMPALMLPRMRFVGAATLRFAIISSSSPSSDVKGRPPAELAEVAKWIIKEGYPSQLAGSLADTLELRGVPIMKKVYVEKAENKWHALCVTADATAIVI